MRTTAIALFALVGCIDEFHGSDVQVDFGQNTPVQASMFGAQRTGELPSNIHFTLYAFDEMTDSTGTSVGRLFELQQFEIHRVVDLGSPCYIDVGEHVPIPGLHVSQYATEIAKQNGFTDPLMPPADATEQQKRIVATAVQRQRNAEAMASDMGVKAITSQSQGTYLEPVAASCTDTNGIPPPECTDADSNRRRLEKCQAAWASDPAMFEGTDRVLTRPLNGTTYGTALGMNPVNMAPVGGAGFFVDESLDDFDGYAIYWQYDDVDHDGQPDYPSNVPAADRSKLGVLYLFGRPMEPSRGVIHVHMTSLVAPSVVADLAIFSSIDEDTVHF